MPILDFFAFIIYIINAVIVPLVFGIAFLLFIIGIVRYFIAGGDEDRKKGRQFAIWGIIAIAIMVSVWGLVNILVNTFGFRGQSRPPLPSFGTQGLDPGSGIFEPGGFGKNLPLGAPCGQDSECASDECDAPDDWDGTGSPQFICVPQRTNN